MCKPLALSVCDAALEKRLREDVAAAQAAYLVDPSNVLPAEDVFARLHTLHALSDAKGQERRFQAEHRTMPGPAPKG